MTLDSEYVQKISKWVDLDNAIEKRKGKLKLFTDEKKKIEDEILDYIEDNEMTNIQINITDGYIKFFENKGFQGLTLKTLKELLQKFFNDDPRQVNAETIYDYISKNRDIKTKLSIKRHITS